MGEKKEIEVGDNLGCALIIICLCFLAATCHYISH